MENKGYIYKITNDINDKVYIGETTRSIETRFSEHCFDNRSTSKIHKAIAEYGWQHFKIEEIEQVPISKLYEREAYWVKYYNSFYEGYNGTETGQAIKDFKNTRYYDSIHVIEPDIWFDSKEEMAREIAQFTSWGNAFLKDKISEGLNTNFLGYHLEQKKIPYEQISPIDDRENWIKNLNIEFAGKRIHCIELNKDFDTIGEASQFILENGYYIGTSKIPIQSIRTSIGKQLNGKSTDISSIKENLHFEYLPGFTKNEGKIIGGTTKIHCNELNLDFESITEAGRYMVDNGYWTVKLKTARCRISDIVNGIFPDYKGYSFTKI